MKSKKWLNQTSFYTFYTKKWKIFLEIDKTRDLAFGV